MVNKVVSEGRYINLNIKKYDPENCKQMDKALAQYFSKLNNKTIESFITYVACIRVMLNANKNSSTNLKYLDIFKHVLKPALSLLQDNAETVAKSIATNELRIAVFAKKDDLLEFIKQDKDENLYAEVENCLCPDLFFDLIYRKGSQLLLTKIDEILQTYQLMLLCKNTPELQKTILQYKNKLADALDVNIHQSLKQQIIDSKNFKTLWPIILLSSEVPTLLKTIKDFIIPTYNHPENELSNNNRVLYNTK